MVQRWNSRGREKASINLEFSDWFDQTFTTTAQIKNSPQDSTFSGGTISVFPENELRAEPLGVPKSFTGD